MKTLVTVRSSSWVLLLGLCVSFVAASGLPMSWGWENGPLENFQAVTLLIGMLVAWMAAYQQRDMGSSKIWLVASMFWLGMFGRELAWGAVFMPPLGVDEHGAPYYTSSVLWWKPAVVWVCVGMLLACVYWVARYRLLTRVVLRWLGERSMPWGCLAVFVLAMVLSAVAEGHGITWLAKLSAPNLMAMEEMSECWAYLALWWAQWRLVHEMQDWRASNYLQTMHFSFSSLSKRFERRSI